MQHRRGGKAGAGALIKVFGLFLVLFLLLFGGIYWFNNQPGPAAWQPAGPGERFFLPAIDSAWRVEHTPAYSLAFAPGREEPLWLACEWDARMEEKAPASFFATAYFQLEAPLEAAWQEWGRRGQTAARRLGRLFVIGGPMPSGDLFLVWLDEGTVELQAVGLILPRTAPQQAFSVPVDSVEARTGLDFFADYWLDSLENVVERSVNPGHWVPEIPVNLYFEDSF